MLPRFLPDDWKGAFVLLVMVFVLSVLPRQHRRGADRRRDGAPAVPRQGAHRLPRGHRRRVERRRLGQRGGRHHHHHDVDRRRRAPAMCSTPTSRRPWRWSCAAFRRRCSSSATRRSSRMRTADIARRLGARRHRRLDPRRGDRDQRGGQRRFRRAVGPLPVHRRRGLGGDPRRPRRCAGRTGSCCPSAFKGTHLPARRWCCAPR